MAPAVAPAGEFAAELRDESNRVVTRLPEKPAKEASWMIDLKDHPPGEYKLVARYLAANGGGMLGQK